MRYHKSILGLLVLSIFIIILASNTASAQPIWLSPDPEQGISIEILKSKFEGSNYTNVEFTSSVWFLSARCALNQNLHFLMDLPVAIYDYEYYIGLPEYWEADAEVTMGNPFVGFELSDRRRTTYGMIGVRLPLINDDKNENAKAYGLVTDVDRTEAFLDHTTPITLRFGIRSRFDESLTFHAYAGPTFWLYHEGHSNAYQGDLEDIFDEIFVDYGAQIWLHTDVVRFGAGITGRYWVSLDDANFDESSVHQFGFAANVGRGRIRPGLHLRFPLDEDWDITGVEYIYGLNLTVLL